MFKLNREHALAILCDLAFTIGGEVSPGPLLLKTLQRFLYHTGFPAGVMLRHDPASPGADAITGVLDVVIGDYVLARAQGRAVPLPAALLSGTSALLSDRPLLASLETSIPMAAALSLPIDGYGHMVLLSPREPVESLPLIELFAPVLPRLATAVKLCREYERRHKESRRLLEEAIEQSPVSILITDAAGTIEYVNREFCANTGYSVEESLGQNPRFLKGGDKPAAEYEHLWRTVTSGAVWRGEFHNRRKDGSRYWEQAVIAPVRDEDGTIAHFVGVKLDVTEKKLHEQEMDRLVDHVTSTDSELERFAYVASHDLREPLRTIVAFTQLLQNRYAGRLDADADEYIDLVVEGAKRMDGLIADLLVYSRIATKGSPFAEVDTAEACAQAIQILRESIEETGARIEIGPLPRLMADEVQLIQLFQNLIGNALKFRHPDRPPVIEVSARTDQASGGWLFSVADNGIGIADSTQDIFDIFRRLHPSSRYPGTGVGLAICRRIVLRHGGEIWFDPIRTDGATFFFTLPG